MRQTLPNGLKAKSIWFQHAGKGVAVVASTGAAFVSIISALYSYGILGDSEAHQSIGNLGAAWVRLQPTVDSATSIGDTIHFAATIADKNGSILVGARPAWTTGDSSIAKALPSGAVVARGPGATTVSVVVGNLVATSRILVKQRVAGVVISSTAGDTTAVINEGAHLQLRARALDARGFPVVQAGAVWHIDDTTVAKLDSSGVLTGRDAGRSVVVAKIQGATGYLPVSVVTTATALVAVAGANQHALAGSVLAQPVVVRATNRKGQPATLKSVTFRVADGHGSVEPVNAVTDADGRARTKWTLGGYPGRQTLLATVESVDSAIAIVAEADPIAANTRAAPVVEQFRGRAGEQLADTIALRVTDSTGRVLADVPVRWTVVDGGIVEALAARTDTLGVARARWTLAKKTGTQRLRAQVGAGAGLGVPAVTISAFAAAGTPASVVVVDGDNQRAAAGAALRKAIAIRVLDPEGNGVSDVAVVLSPSAGTTADTTLKTDSLGGAKVRWTMGRSAGAHSLALHVEGLKNPPKLSAHATPAAPANLSFDDAPSEGSARSRTKRLLALVTDIYGNPVPDAPVTFSVKTGTVSPGRALTDAKGQVAVRWTLGAQTGEQTLRGAVRATDVKGSYVIGAPAPATKTAVPPAATKTPAPASSTKTTAAASSTKAPVTTPGTKTPGTAPSTKTKSKSPPKS
jgi:adhesin/invasin